MSISNWRTGGEENFESIAGLARLARRPESTEKVREALNGDSDKKVTRDTGR